VTDGFDLAQLQARLQDAARRFIGLRTIVLKLRLMEGGHAGYTFGFEFASQAGSSSRGAILKLGPPGVERRGAGDIFRQVALLQALRERGIPVPAILWAEPGEESLGVPYIVMDKVAGKTHFPLLKYGEVDVSEAESSIWHQGLEALRKLDSFPALTELGAWEAPRSIDVEFASWEATLRKSPEPAWIEGGLRARDALALRMPVERRVALVHGDFQSSNLMSSNGTLNAIIDWDLAHLGTSGLDAGWLMMWSDPEYWGSHWQLWSPLSAAAIARQFAGTADGTSESLGWFHAYAGYRFGAIACLNVRLHRNGRRPDLIWELFAQDIPRLFARSKSLAEALPIV